MTRPKTITDEELLAVARTVFRAQGHTASTRSIARAAGVSEGILYQRFGNKEELFFAAMAPSAPDIDALLGPEPPTVDGATFVRDVLARLALQAAGRNPTLAEWQTYLPAAAYPGVHPRPA